MMKGLVALSLLFLMGCSSLSSAAPIAQNIIEEPEVRGHHNWLVRGLEKRPAPKVILLTVDGLRWQELFRGIDPIILNAEKEHSGVKNPEALRKQFWREDSKARRQVLFPNFWRLLPKEGVVYGNRDLGSEVRVKNPHWISYPGYAEMITGEVQEKIIENDAVQIPNPTVWEFIKEALHLSKEKLACIASWNRFYQIAEQRPGTIVVNAGYDRFIPELSTPGMKAVSDAQFSMRTPWDDVRHDLVTMTLSMEYLKAHKPVALHIALGETDDWGHERRYDRVIQAAHMFDRFLGELWTWLQSEPFYREQTTVIIAADHGRGVELKTWIRHRPHIPSSETSWIAVLGPATSPQGERMGGPELYITQVAPMIVEAMDLEWSAYNKDIVTGGPEGAISWKR